MNHARTAITRPSLTTMRRTARSAAPTARIIPISRVRSNTLMLIVPASPKPPTKPIRIAISDSTTLIRLNRSAKIARSSERLWMRRNP